MDLESEHKQFSNCISLGWLCATAGSMSKYGFRNFSGPFDWYYSDFKSVVRHIDNGFSDFLMRDNLVVCDDNTRIFEDKKYGYKYFHDIRTNLDSDYVHIREKYDRRIERFYEKIKQPTLFLRAVRSSWEKEYIIADHCEIDGILKKYHSQNEVIYLTADIVGDLPKNIKSFRLNISEYMFDAASSRNMFDNAPDLVNYCRNTLDDETIQKNIVLDRRSNYACAADVYAMISESDEKVLKGLSSIFSLDIDRNLYIYGIGYQGIAMIEYLLKKDVMISGLIDSFIAGREFKGYKIMSNEEIADGSNIFVTIADSESVKDVRELLKEKHVHICDYTELVNRINEIK